MLDDDFIASFENGCLANESFHHSDHVKMAFLFLERYPPLEALRRFSTSLVNFAAAKGKPGLYNETITWAFLFLIHERILRAAHPQTWPQFAAANEDLLSWEDNVLKKYYREETLCSDLAKSAFLLPDKITSQP
jgi:hypothetical protein